MLLLDVIECVVWEFCLVVVCFFVCAGFVYVLLRLTYDLKPCCFVCVCGFACSGVWGQLWCCFITDGLYIVD